MANFRPGDLVERWHPLEMKWEGGYRFLRYEGSGCVVYEAGVGCPVRADEIQISLVWSIRLPDSSNRPPSGWLLLNPRWAGVDWDRQY